MKSQIENILTRIPMYLVVGASLWILVITAIFYSTAGIIPFDPLQIVTNVLVFIMAVTAASYGLGKLYGIHSHLQSSLITGLILSLIFTPTTDGIVLLQYALIGVIAAASKFVITPRRRHVFNPAAFGAFVGGLLGFQYASWWIGSPTFIFVVAVVSLIVLYKTRQLLLGGLFLAISAVIISTVGIIQGQMPLQAIQTALFSWPIVFMAGIMLSEPLTLPPQRNQRMMLAVVVAILTGLPFHIGQFNSSPEFSLLIGNLFALGIAWRYRNSLALTLAERTTLTSSSKELVFSSAKPLYFEAGQYVELTLPHSHQDIRGIRRAFSITSRPGEQQLRLGIKFYDPSSTFKQALLKLPIGTSVQATGISGDFTLPKNPRQKLLFIAGGIGITPFISHIRSLTGKKTDITVLYFNRKPTDIAYKDFLDNSSAKVHYFVSQKGEDKFTEASRLTVELMQNYIRDLNEREVYISGSPSMVANAKSVIGSNAQKVHTDYFSGY